MFCRKGHKNNYFLQSNFEDELFSIKSVNKFRQKNFAAHKQR